MTTFIKKVESINTYPASKKLESKLNKKQKKLKPRYKQTNPERCTKTIDLFLG